MAGSVGAVALGANVIEKHSTFSKKMAGPDHAASLEFTDLKDLIDLCKKVKISLGKPIKKIHNSEKIIQNILSRKLVCRHKIEKGIKFDFKNVKPALLYAKSGLKTNEFLKVLKKRAKRDLPKGHVITQKDLTLI